MEYYSVKDYSLLIPYFAGCLINVFPSLFLRYDVFMNTTVNELESAKEALQAIISAEKGI
jgi:hypothetical protein